MHHDSIRHRGLPAQAFILLVTTFLVPVLPAHAGDVEDAAAIAAGLRDFAGVLDSLGSFEALGEDLPLTSADPGELLELDTIFGQSLGLLPASFPDLSSLETAIDNADFTTAGNVTVDFQNPQIVRSGNFVDLTLDIEVTKPVTDEPLDLAIQSGPVDATLSGGGVPLALTWRLENLSFKLDSAEIDPGENFFLSYGATPPFVALPVSASAGTSFDANLGFTEVTVTPSVALDVDVKAQLNDPDSDGRITLDELTTTALEDLFTVTLECDSTPDVDAMLTLASDLIPGQSTLEFTDACLADGLDAPQISWNDIRGFSNVTPTLVLQGVSQLAAAVNASQQVGNLPLPFVREGLTQIADLARPVLDFLESLGIAAIVCGPIDEDPPRGNLLDLDPDQEVYCQAIALEQPSSLTWGVQAGGNGTLVSGASDLDTVSQNPTENAVFRADAAGNQPDVQLTFTDVLGTHTVTRRFLSVQEMIVQLAEIGGFEEVADLVTYDDGNDSLTFHLKKTFDLPEVANLNFDYADQLKTETNLAGLSGMSEATLAVDPGQVELDLVFGVLLADDPDPSVPPTPADPNDPDPITKDRFFIQGKPGGGSELELDGLTATADVKLTGMIGFVEVSAVGDDDPTTPAVDGTGFALGPVTGGSPVFSVDLDLPGINDVTPPIADAMRFREFLRDFSRIDPAFNIKLAGGLRISADVGVTQLSGGIALDWEITDPTDIGRPTITATQDFLDNLKVFDIQPSLGGAHTGIDGNQSGGVDRLVDSQQASFGTADLVNTTLHNLSDGSQCIVQPGNADSGGITCDLTGGRANEWRLGDRYEVGGNTEAMLTVILDTLEEILESLESRGVLDEEIPLVGRTPAQLVAEINEIRDDLLEFRSQQPLAQIICNRIDPNTGSPATPAQSLVGLSAGDEFVCQGLRLTESPATLKWEIEGAGGAVVGPDDVLATVATIGSTPGDYVRFSVTDGGSLGDDFEITLTLNEDNGLSHPVFLPIMPMTLQNLTEILACHLGIPEQNLTIALEDLPAPGQSSPDGVTDLVFGLDYGLCTRDNEDTDLACQDGDRLIDQQSATLRLELPDDFGGSELVGLDATDPQVSLELRAEARLDLVIPLSTNFIPTDVRVKDSTHLEIGTAAAVDDLLIEGNVGPLMLALDGEANFGAKATAAGTMDPMDNTFALTGANSFGDALALDFGSLTDPRMCGSVTTTLEKESGTHDGGAAATNLTDTTMTFDETFVGLKLRNKKDGSSCTVTAVSASTDDNTAPDDEPIDTLECTLVGGLEDLWDGGDGYEVEENGQVVDLDGDVCARLTLKLEDIPLGEIGFRVEELAGNVPKLMADALDDPEGWFLTFPRGLLDNIDIRDLDLLLVFQVLPKVLENIAEALQAAGSLPLIGEGLAELGEITDTFNMEVVEPLTMAVLEVLATTVGETESEIRDFIWDNLPEEGRDLLADTNGSGAPDAGDIVVTGFCDLMDTECADTDDISMLQDLRIRVVLGQGAEPDPDNPGELMEDDPLSTTLPLDFGVSGVPIKSSGSLAAQFGWRLPLEFGINRVDGPYIYTSDPANCPPTAADSGTSLRIGASLLVGDNQTEDCSVDANNLTEIGGYSDSRCIAGQVGFLATYLRDGDEEDDGEADNARSRFNVFAFTKLEADDGRQVVPLTRLIGGTSLDAGLIADARVNMRFRTGFAGEAAADLPSILGTFHLDAGWAFPAPDPDDVEDGTADPNGVRRVDFDDLHLDAGEFFGKLVGPAVKEVQRVSKPLQPVIDTTRAPLPVVSDLSQAVGQGPITILTLIELRNGKESTKLIRNIFELVDFINSLPTDVQGTLLIPLGPLFSKNGDPLPGSFSLDLAEVGKGPRPPSESGNLIDFGTVQSGNATETMSTRVEGAGKAFGVTGLSFPFLDNSSQIFGLLMGEDIVLARYDAGTLMASAGFQYNYGPFLVGPVPVTVAIGGAVTFQARFAMGYDTSGIRKALEGGSIFGGVIDGVFIDDLDAEGCDVPEIALTGEVYAGAGVDLGLVAAGITGGISLTTALNLDDRPDADGRLHIEEIITKLHNPICLFVVEGKLDAFLKAWVRVGFEWFKKKWDWEIVRVTLLEFEIKCSPPPPKAAETFTDLLVLNMGSESRRNARGVAPDRTDERVVISQIDDRLWSVRTFGITQTYGDGGDFDIPGAGPVTIEVDAGDGDDQITAEDGVKRLAGDDGQVGTEDDLDVVVPFTASLRACGGAGRDEIRAGGGADVIYGDSGGSWCEDSGDDDGDRIQGGAAGDEIHGEGGLDNLSGEGGNDVIMAGLGNDVVTGGPGEDQLFGDEGDDNLNGGWPASQRAGTDPEDPGVDMADLIVGGEGDDAIEGSFGDDVIYGDFESDGTPLPKNKAFTQVTVACATGGATGGTDRIVGGEGDDQIWGGFNADGTHESLGGEEGDDFICGGGGADLIDGDDTETFTADGDDLLHGGPGHDGVWGRGGNDRIFGGADNDELFGEAGFDDLVGGDGRDLLLGGDDNDVLVGDDGVITAITPSSRGDGAVAPLDGGFLLSSVTRSADGGAVGAVADCFLEGDESTVPRFGTAAGNADCLFGGAGHDLIFGENGHDTILAEAGEDFVEAGAGDDVVRGGQGGDVVYGHRRLGDTFWRDPAPSVSATAFSDHDELFGDSGLDDLYGGPDADMLRGGAHDDYLEGNQDALAEGDTLYGDGGQDDLIGGTSVAGIDDDHGDTLFGNTGEDVLVGDNAKVSRTGDVNAFDDSAVRLVELLDLESVGGADVLRGNQQNDRLWGGFGDDELWGNQGDDVAYGNPGGDTLYGNEGQDDLVGGSGRTTITTGQTVITDRTTATDGRADADDLIYGGDGPDGDELADDFDVIAGDNAIVDRVLDGAGQWQRNTFNDGVERRVWLFDVAETGAPAAAGTFGADEIHGQAADDMIFAQGGDDVVFGQGGDDLVMGGDGGDEIAGGLGNDDLTGGTGVINDDPAGGRNGRLDGGDEIDGNEGFDVIAGDNAVIARTLVAGQWVTNTFDDGLQHERRILLDIDSADPETGGPDVLNGDGDNDLIYGQAAVDQVHGNDGDDLIEGNAAGDFLHGDAGQDDIVGGTTEVAVTDGDDTITGDGEADVILGDNGEAPRRLDGAGSWVLDPNNGAVVRDVRLFDVATLTNPVDPALSAGDVITGNDGDDRIFGQGGGDEIRAGEGVDVVEGNGGDDELFGDGGEDDLIGGGSANDGVIQAASRGDGLLDGEDRIRGGDESDVIAGDNARLTRPTDGSGLWIVDPNTDDAVRDVHLFDVELVAAAADPAVHGFDRLFGEDDHDRIFGQGDGDEIRGGGDFDLVEGNAGADLIFGDEGEDDLVGGGSANDGVIQAASRGDGLLDGDDEIRGGGEGDVIAGDNARLTRATDGSGLWFVDPNVDDVFRTVQLFDVEVIGGAVVDPSTSGSDLVFGEAGRDLLFGQGNADVADDDLDGRFSEDPADGVDNDHDGRESLASLGYDCEDGADNDGDGLADALDPECLVAIDEDRGGDVIVAGPGVDYVEGNHGADFIFGDEGEDDVIGGSSAGDGLIGGGAPPTGLADADDVIVAGDEDDHVVADNAIVERPVDGGGLWQRHTGFDYDFAVRVTTMSEVPEPFGAFGHDYVEGNAGQDEVYGQMGHDYLEGRFGDDVLVGDLGQVTTTVEDGSRTRTIESRSPFLEAEVFVAGTLTRETELYAFVDGDGAEGHDVLLGGDGADNLHGGPGDDILNGDGDGFATGDCEDPFEDPDPATADADQVLAGDGNDAAWGGRGDDHVWGGYGDDHLDVKPRDARAATQQDPAQPADPPEWHTWGLPDSFEGFDLVYGGWDQDAMQGDVGGPGTQPGDRLIDWAGAYNVYYVCPGAYGEGMITRAQAPDLKRFLEDLIENDGAVQPVNPTTSGFRELGFVHHNETRFNTNPIHPDHPGHFTCFCEEVSGGGDPVCLEQGAACSADGDCCSGRCTGKPGAQTCN